MKIKEKIMMDLHGLEENGPINIVIFGDSVSHGSLKDCNDYENVYWNLLKKKLNRFRDYIPVNMINASIGGTTAKKSLCRLERQVLIHQPDLVIVCFGLNDVNGSLEDYLSPLETIFKKCADAGTDVIFMTPNMLNTRVAEDTAPRHYNYAIKTAEIQNSGRMDQYVGAAVELASSLGVTVCDCYAKWKEISKTQDVTMLLINRIDHPISEMHHLFANSLFDVIIGDSICDRAADSTMFRENND